jgi:tetratricopeptide (TPR) repeat protein
MARSAAGRRPKPAAARPAGRRAPAPPRQPRPEDLMFFPRLRRQAKWMFVFLALVFGVGFVAFGVGSSLPSGVADILQGSSSTGIVSVEDAEKKVEKNPNDAEAQKELSEAYQRDRNLEAAIPPLTKYVQLRPKDTNALGELAGLYTTQASRAQEEGSAAQKAYADAAGITVFQNAGSSNLFQSGALDKLILDDAQKRAQEASEKVTTAYGNATATYGKLTKLTPKDAELWYLMALSAESANKLDVAIRGYQQFLKLSPDAAEARIVKDRIKSLLQAAKQSATVTRGGVTTITR